MNPDAEPALPLPSAGLLRSGSAGFRVRYFARAYTTGVEGEFRIAAILEAESEAHSLVLAERLSAEHVGAIAFALRSPSRPVLDGLGRFGRTPD